MTTFGKRLLKAAKEARAIARGQADPSTYRTHVPADIDVKRLRRHLRLSQAEFAQRFGFTPARIRDWEQGRSKPDGAVRAYLMVIEREPRARGASAESQLSRGIPLLGRTDLVNPFAQGDPVE